MEEVQKILRTIAWGLLILIVLLAIITAGNISLLSSLFRWVYDVVSVTLGTQGALAKAITSLFVGAIVFLPLGKMALSPTPIPQANKGFYRALIFGCFAVFWLFVFFGSKDTYFNVKTGEPIKYYSQSADGSYKFYDEPGYDPITGDPLRPVTKDVVIKSRQGSSTSHSNPRPTPSYHPSDPSPPSQQRQSVTPVVQQESQNVSNYNPDPPVIERVQQVSPKESPFKTPNNSYADICQASFVNKGNSVIVIANSAKKELLRISPHEMVNKALKPGTYYFKPARSHRWQSLSVPRKESWSVALASK